MMRKLKWWRTFSIQECYMVLNWERWRLRRGGAGGGICYGVLGRAQGVNIMDRISNGYIIKECTSKRILSRSVSRTQRS